MGSVYSQLGIERRIFIEVLLRNGASVSRVAAVVKCHRTTVWREIGRAKSAVPTSTLPTLVSCIQSAPGAALAKLAANSVQTSTPRPGSICAAAWPPISPLRKSPGGCAFAASSPATISATLAT